MDQEAAETRQTDFGKIVGGPDQPGILVRAVETLDHEREITRAAAIGIANPSPVIGRTEGQCQGCTVITCSDLAAIDMDIEITTDLVPDTALVGLLATQTQCPVAIESPQAVELGVEGVDEFPGILAGRAED